jgi:hypothetical protein
MKTQTTTKDSKWALPKRLGIGLTSLIAGAIMLNVSVYAQNLNVLPVGHWLVNANGFTGPGDLNIVSVAANGVLTATLFGSPITGFWDSNSKKITFLRIQSLTDPKQNQLYTGYIFANPALGGFLYQLTGSFEALGVGGSAKRTVFGWRAEKVRSF